MLPKSKRLTTAEFDAVMEKGKTAHSPLFLVRWTSSEKQTAFSAVSGKKVVSTAAGRNYMRRKIYEALRKLGLTSVSGVHAIIFAKSPAVEADQEVLANDLKSIFVKAGLLR